MPVNKERFDSRMTILFQTGTDVNGEAILTRRNYNGVKPAATDQEIYEAGLALVGLQTLSLYGINRTNIGTLEQS